jgi:hypothetical protein
MEGLRENIGYDETVESQFGTAYLRMARHWNLVISVDRHFYTELIDL